MCGFRILLIVVLSVVGLVGGVASADAQTATPGAVFVPWANKFFDAANPPPVLVHDFGSVPHGTLLTKKFTITNIYDVPMQIIDIRKSCSCLDALPPTQVLMPHDTAELTLTMNTAKFNGANAQSFFITFGPQFVSTAVIRVQAVSRTDIAITPGEVNFGVVTVGAEPTQTVKVQYQGKQKDWQIVGVYAPTGPITVEAFETKSREFQLKVKLNADAPAGALAEPITLKTNDPTTPLLQVRVSGLVQAPVSIAPNAVRFDDLSVGEERSVKVILRATKPFRIQPIAPTADGLSVELFPGSAPVQIVTVNFKPLQRGAQQRIITFDTDLGPVSLTVDTEAK